MSCWVVPAVAAEYWGVSLNVVWDRIYNDLVPHKTERGFVFIDVDPWNSHSTKSPAHPPPPTFVAADDRLEPYASNTLVCEEDELSEECLSDDEELMLDGGDLPELDEEESATFGRLSWQEVRESVSRTRRPPPRAA